MQRNRPGSRGESGNVFAIVMIGVVLFGALMYTFSRSARQGDGNLSQKKSEVVASDILAYAQRLERGVNRVMTRGCSEDFISFEHAGYVDYPVNPESPPDKSCHVFDPAGGGISPLPDDGFSVSGLDIRPSGGSALSGIGDARQDLVVWFSGLPETLCRELNRRVDYAGAIPAFDSVHAWEYGDYAITPGEHWGTGTLNLGALSGLSAGCGFQDDVPPNAEHLAQGYSFYYVLMAR